MNFKIDAKSSASAYTKEYAFGIFYAIEMNLHEEKYLYFIDTFCDVS